MVLAVDIGGTDVKMGFVNEQGDILARHRASVCFDRYQTPILDTVLKEAERFVKQSALPIQGIGVSATGQIDMHAGSVIGSNGRLPSYEGSAIRKRFDAVFSAPTFVLNDANAAALGECFCGAGRGYKHVLMVTLGTGVGGGIVIGGELLTGQIGIAGEIGHFALYQNGVRCSCGKKGCFENYASVTALITRAKRKTHEADLTGETIFRLANEGDKRYLSIIDRWVDDIAGGIGGLVHILNPQLVLIGGAVSCQEKYLIEPLRSKVYATVMPRFCEELRIERAALGNDAGLIGAAKYCMDQTKKGAAR